jgi:hypothetical protein
MQTKKLGTEAGDVPRASRGGILSAGSFLGVAMSKSKSLKRAVSWQRRNQSARSSRSLKVKDPPLQFPKGNRPQRGSQLTK